MSKHQDFKFIQGACKPGCPADICFYTDVDYWSVDKFLCEFDYLANCVSPSKIRIHINSAGGSVVDGMSVFSKIIDCQIPTETINDALAASMGSIIWAAGDELYMKDYALLMIHNPFCDNNGQQEYNQVTDAFKQQLKTIYTKRFGLCDDEIEAIMNGNEGEDGTFMTSAQAVEKGFCKPENVLDTPKVAKDKIMAAISGVRDIAKIQAIYNLALPVQDKKVNNNQITNSTNNKMEENKVSVFAALFGLTGEKANADNVIAQINELKAETEKSKAIQKSLEDAKAELTQVKAELTGAQTSVKNLKEDLQKTQAALKAYQDADAKAQAEKVNALIEKAVADCKINKEECEDYLKMAQDNFELAERVLAKIPARDNLGQVISTANAGEAKDNMKSEDEKIQAKIEEVVGKNFKFRTI